MIKRRDLIALLGGGAVFSWPLVAGAQRSAKLVVGMLGSNPVFLPGFRQGLSESGFVDGQNVAIDVLWDEGHYERLPAMAAELVGRKVDVIIASTPPAARAAKAATSTIPIVFTIGTDPVRDGLVTSLNRPDGNITGVAMFVNELEAKRLALLCEMVPHAAVIAVLVNPTSPAAETQMKDVTAAAEKLRQQIRFLQAGTTDEIDATFATLVKEPATALLVVGDPFFFYNRDRLALLAARQWIPAIYAVREYISAGGLSSYGTSLFDAYRETGVYAAKILKGARIADLPVMQATKFELVFNLKTAKALGITIPPTLLARADEVIE